jgi:hypothetical protein
MVHRKFVIMVCALLTSLLSFAGPAHAATAGGGIRLRVIAYEYAAAQAGKSYCWGGDGPSCYDCSGLVYEAYLQAGIQLPRTTYEMLDSPLLVQISRSQAKRGGIWHSLGQGTSRWSTTRTSRSAPIPPASRSGGRYRPLTGSQRPTTVLGAPGVLSRCSQPMSWGVPDRRTA